MTDYHVHTTYCDGADAAEKTVLRACDLGLTTLGFSGHSYNIYDGHYCMSREDTPVYRDEIFSLREKYKDKIEILCGIEQDFTSGVPEKGFDYVIGSVHHIVCDGESIPVDNSPELLLSGVEKYFGGDLYAYCERYFSDVARMGHLIRPDIIGHFDLVSKFFEKKISIDEKNPRYVAAYTAAIEELVKLGVPFEINTGAISRGWRTTPYPSLDQIKKIAEYGGKFILTSDCHAANTLCFEFEKWGKMAEEMGLCVLPSLPLSKKI